MSITRKVFQIPVQEEVMMLHAGPAASRPCRGRPGQQKRTDNAAMCGTATIKSESRVVQLNAVAQHKRQWEAHGLAAGRRGDTDLYVGRDTGRDGLPIPTDDRRRFS
jgi:hypothetical protein